MKRLICLFLGAICALGLTANALDVAAPSAVLMDAATGTVLFEKNSHERLAPASVTKIMTLLLVMEGLEAGSLSWDAPIVASDHAAGKGGSQVYLEPGESMTMDEMLKSVVVASANDCATALAEQVAGTEEAFVEKMNQRAGELGMADTNFVNCTGLDDEPNAETHLTSAYDIALMSRALLSHEKIKDYTTIWMDTVRDGAFGLSNTNKLVRFYPGTTGLKTGFTQKAGYCLSASAEKEGMELIAVVLHCAASAERFNSAKQLLDYGFATYRLVTPEENTGTVPVLLGKQESILPVLEDATPILMEKGAAIRQEAELVPEITAPVEAGQCLGTLRIYAGDSLTREIPLVAPEGVEKMGILSLGLAILREII